MTGTDIINADHSDRNSRISNLGKLVLPSFVMKVQEEIKVINPLKSMVYGCVGCCRLATKMYIDDIFNCTTLCS